MLALLCAAAIILSAPYAQWAFSEADTRWPAQFETLGTIATVGPVGGAVLLALVRIRDRRPLRYLALAASLGLGLTCIRISGLAFPETFHFAEYGLLAWLLYRVWDRLDVASALALPVLAGTLVGVLDEWFQWFIPIRAGESRDIAINSVAVVCGLLFAVSLDPPNRLTLAVGRARRVRAWGAAVILTFALFFWTVQVGHEVSDPEIGTFRSRYTGAELAAAARDRAETWRSDPPVVLRRLSREDQYLSEGEWRVHRRNQLWNDGDAFGAWSENRILEKFYAPVLDIPDHRWPAEQRAEAIARAGPRTDPYVSDAYPYPMYVWRDFF